MGIPATGMSSRVYAARWKALEKRILSARGSGAKSGREKRGVELDSWTAKIRSPAQIRFDSPSMSLLRAFLTAEPACAVNAYSNHIP